jgi:hypothetical protein
VSSMMREPRSETKRVRRARSRVSAPTNPPAAVWSSGRATRFAIPRSGHAGGRHAIGEESAKIWGVMLPHAGLGIGILTATTVDLAVEAAVVQMLATPLEGDLQNVVEVSQKGIAMYEEAAPDERADASQDDAQLIDGRQCGTGRQARALSVAQCVASLKESPQILALSPHRPRRARGGHPVVRA